MARVWRRGELITSERLTSLERRAQPGSVSVMDHGAVGDGLADDTAAFEEAIRSAGVGGAVWVPAGTYLLSRPLTLPYGSVLHGDATYVSSDHANGATLDFSACRQSGVTLIRSDGEVRGLRVVSDSIGFDIDRTRPGTDARGDWCRSTVLRPDVNGVSARGVRDCLISGMSGTGVAVAQYQTCTGCQIQSCGLGASMGADSMLTRSRIYTCVDAVNVTWNDLVSDVRIDEIAHDAILVTGNNSNLCNISADFIGEAIIHVRAGACHAVNVQGVRCAVNHWRTDTTAGREGAAVVIDTATWNASRIELTGVGGDATYLDEDETPRRFCWPHAIEYRHTGSGSPMFGPVDLTILSDSWWRPTPADGPLPADHVPSMDDLARILTVSDTVPAGTPIPLWIHTSRCTWDGHRLTASLEAAAIRTI
ncbi:glycosyl hydrolase family 28-related protein [Bifidobacterium callimiconis]|uniref:Endopolygalacturonase n=1 Tax=Bifidobacterium callimiconis TaxID=2306973 RepID=A0A430FIP3_9BIFI|nr:glycosyl hydrolase family 28-related protein [Bifidobacterium callimiconis]RSX52642.1 endopolygalacturonase [Bifidobacterium callimiconis]